MQSIKLRHWQMGIFVVLLALTILVCGMYIQTGGSLAGNIVKNNTTTSRDDDYKKMLMPISDVSGSDVLLDISENSSEHINGSRAIPYTEFIVGGGRLKSVPEIAAILGGAGISRSDNVVIYGECMPCGGGPAPATYVYWMMKCLGHENLWVLDGNVEDWALAGRPITNSSQAMLITDMPDIDGTGTDGYSKNYAPNFTTDLFATYDYVKRGDAQVVDARLAEEREEGTIPGAVSIPYESVLDGHRIKNETGLEKVFINLSRNRPVVVFTDTGIKASVVWFSLKLLGYEARLYSWSDWLENQPPEGNFTSENNKNNMSS
jgi:thiosulfate/3-mercaptopyruvate sulfurtransferase